ncbi:MAG TPA: hypothetical protein DD638_02855, partial [Pasteurellaceae bacterium]|nr:hypothetical protein [Pasteurellaceae bacterium]
MIIHRVKSAVRKTCFFLTALYSITVFADGAKLAIIIDDIGYHPRNDNAVLAMPKEIAVAIIPSAPYAKQRNQQASEQGRDILI